MSNSRRMRPRPRSIRMDHGIGSVVVILRAERCMRTRVNSSSKRACRTVVTRTLSTDQLSWRRTRRVRLRDAWKNGRLAVLFALNPSAAAGTNASNRRKAVDGRR